MSLLDKLVTLAKQAGAPTEQSTDRGGAFSWHAETHAFVVGAGVSWIALTTGQTQLLAGVLPAITAALHGKKKSYGKILTDVYQEYHYALGGILFGAILAIATGVGNPSL